MIQTEVRKWRFLCFVTRNLKQSGWDMGWKNKQQKKWSVRQTASLLDSCYCQSFCESPVSVSLLHQERQVLRESDSVSITIIIKWYLVLTSWSGKRVESKGQEYFRNQEKRSCESHDIKTPDTLWDTNTLLNYSLLSFFIDIPITSLLDSWISTWITVRILQEKERREDEDDDRE